jgi:hypothetical protein
MDGRLLIRGSGGSRASWWTGEAIAIQRTVLERSLLPQFSYDFSGGLVELSAALGSSSHVERTAVISGVGGHRGRRTVVKGGEALRQNWMGWQGRRQTRT